MRNSLKTILALVALAPAAALAVPINGGISMFGDFDAVDASGASIAGLDQATGLDFINDDFIVDTATGDLAAAGISKNDTGTINDFQFNPLNPAPVNPLWSVGGFEFVLQSVTIDTQTTSSLILNGTGYMRASGFEDTYGSWSFKATAKIGQFFFGSTTTTVPEPATLMLFGAGLMVIGFSARRRINRKH